MVLIQILFNNQGVHISNPESLASKQGKNGTGEITTAKEQMAMATEMMGGNKFSFLGSIKDNITRKVDKVTQQFHPSQGNKLAHKFHPAQGNAHRFHPSQGGLRKGSASKQGTAFDPSQGNRRRRTFDPSQGNRQRTTAFDPSQGNSYNPYVRQSETPSDQF